MDSMSSSRALCNTCDSELATELVCYVRGAAGYYCWQARKLSVILCLHAGFPRPNATNNCHGADVDLLYVANSV